MLDKWHGLASRIDIQKGCGRIRMKKSSAMNIFGKAFFVSFSILMCTIPNHPLKECLYIRLFKTIINFRKIDSNLFKRKTFADFLSKN